MGFSVINLISYLDAPGNISLGVLEDEAGLHSQKRAGIKGEAGGQNVLYISEYVGL